jgi:glycosyltransferase involved in cell wall biosynthesis
MKLLRVIASMNPSSGGPCQGIRNIVPELHKLGIDNEVICLDAPGASFLGKDTFPVHALGPSKGPWGYSEKLVPWLLMHMENFDLIIIHGLWLYHSHAVIKAVKRYRKEQAGNNNKVPEVFIMPHGMLDPYFQKASGRKLKAVRNQVYWKLIEGSVINEADGVLFTCEEELLLARQPFHPYKPQREINIGYGVTAPPACNRQMQEAFSQLCPQVNNRKYLLFLSRIHEKKGLDLLIRAYMAVVNKLGKKEEAPLLVIAGPGLESAYGQQMKALAASHKETEEMIFFPGMLSGDTKWGAFYGATAFVLPSHQENFGIAVVEALACETPVLITDKINIYREIESGKAGLIAADTLEGIEKMLLNWFQLTDDQKKQLRQNARNTYLAKFTTEIAAQNFKKLMGEG